ncbi:MAG TPA: hypothetical protein ENJ33_06945 [Thiothrix sp.]|nr:hypothetical protein [Thiothrix sp.]
MASSGIKEHSQTGIAYAVVVFGYVFYMKGYLPAAVIVATAAFIGSVIPDIDSHRSAPRKFMLYSLMVIGAWVGYLSTDFLQLQQDYFHITRPNPFYSAIIGFCLGYVTQLIAGSLLVHRGVTHSVMGAILLGLIMASLFSFVINMADELLIAVFLATMGGVFVHQLTDWAYGSLSKRNHNHLLFTLAGHKKENIFLLFVTFILVSVSQIGGVFYPYFLSVGFSQPDVWIYLSVLNFILLCVFLTREMLKKQPQLLKNVLVNVYWFSGCTAMAFFVSVFTRSS